MFVSKDCQRHCRCHTTPFRRGHGIFCFDLCVRVFKGFKCNIGNMAVMVAKEVKGGCTCPEPTCVPLPHYTPPKPLQT